MKETDEEWEARRRAELMEEIPIDYTANIGNNRLNLWIGRLGIIEYKIESEKLLREIFNYKNNLT